MAAAVVVGKGPVKLLLPAEFPLEVDDAGGDGDQRLVRGLDLVREGAEVLVASLRAGESDRGVGQGAGTDDPAGRPYRVTVFSLRSSVFGLALHVPPLLCHAEASA
jgi:hypothetical protein